MIEINWTQSWMAVPVALLLPIVLLGHKRLWHAWVEAWNVFATVLVDWVVEPLRYYFWILVKKFETLVLHKLVFTPLVKITLLRDDQFDTFVCLFYSTLILALAFFLFHRMPPLLPIVWSGGRVRHSVLLAVLYMLGTFSLLATASLYQRGSFMHAMVVLVAALFLLASAVYVYNTYPDTSDLADFKAAFPWLSESSGPTYAPLAPDPRTRSHKSGVTPTRD